MRRSTAIQLSDQSDMIPSGNEVHHHPRSDERGAKPQRQAVRLGRGSMLGRLESCRKSPKRATTNPNPIKAKPVRIHASRVRSAAR